MSKRNTKNNPDEIFNPLVAQDENLNLADIGLFFILKYELNNITSYPSVKYLQYKYGLGSDAIKNHINNLTENGYLRRYTTKCVTDWRMEITEEPFKFNKEGDACE